MSLELDALDRINFDLRDGVYVVPKVLDSGYLMIGKHRMDFKRQE